MLTDSEQRRLDQRRQILEIIEVQQEICNDWELNFLDSVLDWTLARELSPKQLVIVERIYAKACVLPERAKIRKPKKKKKAKPRKLQPDEAWSRASTPKEGDEEILF